MENIKWGIIGCGNVTEVKSGPAFNLVGKSELVAVMRRDIAKAKDYAKRHGVPKWYNNAAELINDADVNAIYIATPPNVHAKYAIEALSQGKPVYVEKPMALNYPECLDMIQASEAYNTKLFVAYYRRALPSFLKVKELIDNKAIGKVRFVNIQFYKSLSKAEVDGALPWRVDPKIAGGGHFFDMASHQLDFLDFVFGPVHEVQSVVVNQAKRYESEDMVSASLLLPDGVVVNGTWSFSVPSFLERDIIEVIGSEGKITFSCFGFMPIQLEKEDEQLSFDYPKPKHVQQDMIQLVVDDLLGGASCTSIGLSGARTSWVMDEVVKAYYEKK